MAKDKENIGKQNSILKIVLVAAVALIAISLFVYVIKISKTKTTFEVCYEECQKLGTPPIDGKCTERQYLGVRKTTKGEWKKGDPWCYTRAGLCLTLCKD